MAQARPAVRGSEKPCRNKVIVALDFGSAASLGSLASVDVYPIALTIASINKFDGNGLVKNAMPPAAAALRLIDSSSNAVMNMVGYL